MKPNKFVLSMAIVAMSLSMTSVGSAALSGTTKATIQFEVLEVPEILNPEQPDLPLTPSPNDEDGDVNQETGELTLDFVPHLNFGKHEVKTNRADRYKALATPNTPGPFVQVTDRRPEMGDWQVTVSASLFENQSLETPNTSLPGAVFMFERGKIVGPTSQGMPSAGLKINEMIELIPDEDAIDIMTAESGAGQFTWLAHWLDGGVYLDIPQNTIQKGMHVSILTWTLAPNLD